MNRMMLPGVNFPVTGRVSANSVDIDAVLLAGIIKDNPVTVELIAPLGMPPEVLLKVQDTWNNFKGPVNTTRKFSVFYEHGESCAGFVVVELKWDGKLDVAARIFDEDDEEIVGSPLWVSALRNLKTLEKARFEPERLWKIIVPVVQIKNREKVTQPNAPCVCGSGKKYKKCCGRIV
jgi:hypothetical protein